MNVIKKEYDDPKLKHPEFKKTLKKINQIYY